MPSDGIIGIFPRPINTYSVGISSTYVIVREFNMLIEGLVGRFARAVECGPEVPVGEMLALQAVSRWNPACISTPPPNLPFEGSAGLRHIAGGDGHALRFQQRESLHRAPPRADRRQTRPSCPVQEAAIHTHPNIKVTLRLACGGLISCRRRRSLAPSSMSGSRKATRSPERRVWALPCRCQAEFNDGFRDHLIDGRAAGVGREPIFN